ncbi:hypothetical protein AB0F91_21445 [Amycolatopsis sp. NPDC023774]|uniref:hypothetical protein n=1 Tax=Amycolatopsis sp. NPDC023774 TaxID=3155015 RepID=UPI0033FDAEBD
MLAVTEVGVDGGYLAAAADRQHVDDVLIEGLSVVVSGVVVGDRRREPADDLLPLLVGERGRACLTGGGKEVAASAQMPAGAIVKLSFTEVPEVVTERTT